VLADWCEAVLRVLLLLYDLQQQHAVRALASCRTLPLMYCASFAFERALDS
jgi:hypothetical protein